MYEAPHVTNELTPVISFTLHSNLTTSTTRNTTRNPIQNNNNSSSSTSIFSNKNDNFNNQSSQNISNPTNTSLHSIKTSSYPYNHSNASTVIPQASLNKVPWQRQWPNDTLVFTQFTGAR